MSVLSRPTRPTGASRVRRFALMALLALPLSPCSASAQAVAEILGRALQRQEAGLAGIQNLRIQQSIMGFSATTYMVKEMVDGHPILRPHSIQVTGLPGAAPQNLGDSFWNESRQMYSDWADRWRLEGRGTVDGRATHTLLLDRFDGIDLGSVLPGQGQQQFTPTRLKMEMDVERLVPLHMTMEGTVTQGGQTRPMAVEITPSDYREVNGYLHPFLTVVESDLANSGITPEQREQARRAMQQLEQLPAEQRAMMEQMMGGQLQSLQQMLAGDRLRIEIRVTDLQANVTLP